MKHREWWISDISNSGWTKTEFHKITSNKHLADKLGQFTHVVEAKALNDQKKEILRLIEYFLNTQDYKNMRSEKVIQELGRYIEENIK